MSDNVSGTQQSDVGEKREKGASSSDSSVYKSSAEESVRSKGSKESSLYKSSEEHFETSCDPCATAEKNTEAQGYCTNCEEYLCGNCLKYHSRSKILKDHVLLDKDSMPRKNKKLCDPCQTAGDELQAISYCQNCTEYLCSSCCDSHSKLKQLRKHVLMDIDNIASGFEHTAASSIAKLKIHKHVSSDMKDKEEYTFISDINVKADTDEKDCFITGMTLVANTNLVLCDSDNICLKLVDIESCTIKDVLVLEGKPLGITTISDDQVAVAIEDKYQIQVISLTGGLSVDRKIKTNGKCVDVKFTNGKFYVSFEQTVRFMILQPKGAIIKTIRPDSEVSKHCTSPRHIAINHDESIIYVSDWVKKTFFSMDMDGNMLAIYQNELDTPFDITMSPYGAVFLCSKLHHVVYQMTSDLSDGSVILGPGDGLSYPETICLNKDIHHLYIGSPVYEVKITNFIKVYGWK